MKDDEYTWLNSLLDATKESESPIRFKLWAALYTISVVAKRRVYLNLQDVVTVYPNLYILLLGEAGLGKEFPMGMAEKLLRKADVARIISGRNTIESVIETLGKAVTLQSGVVIKYAEGALISGEFNNLLVANPEAMSLLTGLYECKDIWDYTLRKGQDRLRNVYISLLGASNMEMLEDKLQEREIKGGFISRTICIYETETSTSNSLMGKRKDPIQWDYYAQRLVRISGLHGEMTIEDAGQQAYDAWYYPFRKIQHNDKTGFVNRVRTHILKVAMCLSLIERDDLLITEKHILDAMDLVLPLMKDVNIISKGSGKNKYKSHYQIITMELIRAPEHVMKRRELLERNRGEFNHFELTQSLDTMVNMGIVQLTMVGGEAGVTLTERAIEDLRRVGK